MDRRWCVCDLDGTLLDPQGSVAPRDGEALARLSAAGWGLVLATGRLDLMALRFASALGVTAPVVSCNGALLRDPVTREVVHAQPLPPAQVDRLRAHLERRHLPYLLYTAAGIYFTAGNERVGLAERYNAGSRPEHRVPLWPMEDLDRQPAPALKLLVTHRGEDALADLPGGPGGLAVVVSGHRVIDITAAGTSKAAGLELLARRCGLDLSRTVAFGDHDNDRTMLERCGLAIAMGNAEPALKRIAAFVTRSNAECGVAHAVDTILLPTSPG